MRKIGVFLGSDPPHGSGQFHYIQTILDAVSALPKNEYSSLVLYIDVGWRAYLEALAMHSLKVTPLRWCKFLGDLWMASGLSGSLWKSVSTIWNPLATDLIDLRC